MNSDSSDLSKTEDSGKVILVPTSLIRPFQSQPRKHFDEQKILVLATSIRILGQIVPGFVRRINDTNSSQKYELIDGERRLRALAIAGIDKMKVIVLNVRDELAPFLISVIANFARTGHSRIETAFAIQELERRGLRQRQIASIFAHTQSWVNMHLKILTLDPEVIKMMSPETPKRERLAFSVAYKLAQAPQSIQRQIAEVIIRRRLRLGPARSLISRSMSEEIIARPGDQDRNPKKDYQRLRGFLSRTRRELKALNDLPQSFFTQLLLFRGKQNKDKNEKLKEELEQIIRDFRNVLSAISRAD